MKFDCSRRSYRFAMTFVEVLVVIAIIGIIAGLLMPSGRRSREPSRRMTCSSNCRAIGMALLNYEKVYRVFPPAYTVDANGKPLHSWRTLILPYLEEEARYRKIDLRRAWDDPKNRAAVELPMPKVFSCPSGIHRGQSAFYHVLMLDHGIFRKDLKPVSLSDLSDPSSQSLLLIEKVPETDDHWMAPEEILISDLHLPTSGKSDAEQKEAAIRRRKFSYHWAGFHVGTADGAVHFVQSDMQEAWFNAMLDTSDRKEVDMHPDSP